MASIANSGTVSAMSTNGRPSMDHLATLDNSSHEKGNFISKLNVKLNIRQQARPGGIL